MPTMRELVIDELVYRKHFEPDFSNGLEASIKLRQEQDQAYRETLVNVSDADLLFDLLDIVGDRVREDARERGAFYSGDL